MCYTMKLISIGVWYPVLITFPVSRTLFIGFSPEWGGTTRLGYTDVLVVREIDCRNWLAQEYMPAHQHCGLFYPLVWGLAYGLLLKEEGPLSPSPGQFLGS